MILKSGIETPNKLKMNIMLIIFLCYSEYLMEKFLNCGDWEENILDELVD